MTVKRRALSPNPALRELIELLAEILVEEHATKKKQVGAASDRGDEEVHPPKK